MYFSDLGSTVELVSPRTNRFLRACIEDEVIFESDMVAADPRAEMWLLSIKGKNWVGRILVCLSNGQAWIVADSHDKVVS
jgi:hypothetical protein